MRKASIALPLAITLLLGIEYSCSKRPTPGWQGSIKVINGTTIVNNPNDPLYGELVFDLKEDLSIGDVQNENYLFSMILRIEKDSDGNIYVLEAGRNPRIQKFSPMGKFLCAFGSFGQGPGEYQAPGRILIDEKTARVAIKDIRKLLIFDKDGNHVDNDVAFELSVTKLWIDSRGSLWGVVNQTQRDTGGRIDISTAFAKLTRDGQIEKAFESYPFEAYTEGKASGIILIVTGGVEFNLHASPLKGRGFVYGYSDKYELNVIDLDGNPVCKIKKNEPYQYFTAEEKKRSSKLRFPEYKPFYYDLFSDSEGRIYVQKNNARLTDPEEKEFDIFSKDGYYIYKTKCSMTPFIIDNGFFYTRIENNETSDVFVKRFKILNWSELKNGI